jgi:hypothetical protein
MTLNELFGAVKEFLDRPNLTDTQLDMFAEVVKGQLNTALKDHPRLQRVGFLDAEANQDLLPLPYDIIALQRVARGTLTLQQFSTAYPRDQICVEGFISHGDCIELTVSQSEATRYRIEYSQSLPLISTPAHWVRDYFPDCMLYGMLCSAAIAFKDRDNIQVWQPMYDRAVGNLAAQGWNQNIAAAPRVVLSR